MYNYYSEYSCTTRPYTRAYKKKQITAPHPWVRRPFSFCMGSKHEKTWRGTRETAPLRAMRFRSLFLFAFVAVLRDLISGVLWNFQCVTNCRRILYLFHQRFIHVISTTWRRRWFANSRKCHRHRRHDEFGEEYDYNKSVSHGSGKNGRATIVLQCAATRREGRGGFHSTHAYIT